MKGDKMSYKVAKTINLSLETTNKLVEYLGIHKIKASHLIEKLLLDLFSGEKKTIILESNKKTNTLKKEKYKNIMKTFPKQKALKTFYLDCKSCFIIDSLSISKNIKKTEIVQMAINLLFEDMKKNGEIDFEFPFDWRE
jgi:hypothetical protein